MNGRLRVVPLTIRVILAALMLTAPLVAYKSYFPTRAEPEKSAGPRTKESSALQQTPAKLGLAIERAINESAFKDSRWGVSVIGLNNGQVLYSLNGDKLFTPASNMKLYTTAVALDLLGGNYRWRTSVYADAQPDANGALKGDLVLYGRGAPDLLSETKNENNNSLAELANALLQKGVREVTGNVIGDASYFRGEPIGDGWQWNDLQWYFGAEASALSINENQVELSVAPPEKSASMPTIRTTDTTGHMTIFPRMEIVNRGERFKLGIQRGLSDNQVQVWGHFPAGSNGYGAQLSVHDPALWAARLFIDALKRTGIAVAGTAQARDSKTSSTQRFEPSHSNELAAVTSQNLFEIIKATNKHSINLNAELILRTLGRERGPMVSDPSGEQERGDAETGAAIISLWLGRNGIQTTGLAIHDGSGLSRLNLVSPESTARLLIAIWRTNSGELFRQTLPVAATDGTLRGRLKGLEKQLSAKTGSLIYDNSLAGYVVAKSGDTFAFSIMCNDQTGPGSSVQVIDQIAELLGNYPNEGTR